MSSRTLLIAFLALVVVADAFAQFGGGTGGRRGTRGGDTGRGQPPERRDAIDTLQLTLEELRIDLKLTAEQQPRWEAYRQKVEALKADIARQRSRAPSTEKLDAVKQLDRLVDAERNRLAAMEEIAAAGSALYGALTAEQKEVADLRLAKLPRAFAADAASPGAERNSALPRLQ